MIIKEIGKSRFTEPDRAQKLDKGKSKELSLGYTGGSDL